MRTLGEGVVLAPVELSAQGMQAAWRAPRPMVGFGDAAALVLTRERALCAELLVVGKRRRGLLAESRGDVLVLPLQPQGRPGTPWVPACAGMTN